MKLLWNTAIKFLCGAAMICLLLFLPAGTWRWLNGWLFIALLFIPMLALGIVLYLKAPALLQKRLDVKEKDATQKSVVALSAVGFSVGFITAGLDFRFGWTHVPLAVVIVASALLVSAYALYAEVMRENTYLSRTVKIEHEQRVVDTGLYGIVRHPMYAATVLLFLMIPLVLGSWLSFIVFWHYPILILVRIRGEEKLLSEQLAGYEQYKQKVKYRLIPFVW